MTQDLDSDPEEWTTPMLVGFIIDEIKDELNDEFIQLEDWDFELTINFPSQFDGNHLKAAVQ
eukprot:3087370-Prorocentrum_lima.AAC.1